MQVIEPSGFSIQSDTSGEPGELRLPGALLGNADSNVAPPLMVEALVVIPRDCDRLNDGLLHAIPPCAAVLAAIKLLFLVDVAIPIIELAPLTEGVEEVAVIVASGIAVLVVRIANVGCDSAAYAPIETTGCVRRYEVIAFADGWERLKAEVDVLPDKEQDVVGTASGAALNAQSQSS